MDKHNPAYEDAFNDWKRGMKYKEIAGKYGVSLSAVKSWATRDWKLRKVATKSGQSCNRKTRSARSRAQVGNQNAVGHGAPKGNTNNLKTGLYAQVYGSVLTDDEKELIQQIDVSDEEAQLQEQIAILTVRELRLMKDLNRMRALSNGSGNNLGMILYSVDRGEWKHEQKNASGHVSNVLTKDEKKNGHSVHMNTTLVSSTDTIVRFEAELTRVQKQKSKCIEQLAEIKEAKKNSGNAGNDSGPVIITGENDIKD